MENKNMSVTLLLPTMNEVEGLRDFMPRIKKEWYDELIIADGGSTDGTVEYCKEKGYTLIQQSEHGLAMGLVSGFRHTTKDIIITLSPDGNSIPELIPQVVEKMKEGYDMVIVSRYLESARSYDDDALTKFGNWMFTVMVNFLFRANYSDCLVIYRAYRREAIYRMGMDRQEEENWCRKNFHQMNSWDMGSSIRAAKLNLKVADIPGDEPKRIGGVRKLSIVVNGTGVLLQVIYEWIMGQRVFKKENLNSAAPQKKS